MARMTRCPRCGADNSAQRRTCYNCQGPLAPAAATPPPANRFEALLRERAGAAAPPPAAGADGLPSAYSDSGRVRRAMVFFRQLHALLAAGLTPGLALRQLQGRRDRQVSDVAGAAAAHVEGGGRLSEVMRRHPGLFLSYQAGLVEAGETSGNLVAVVEQIALDCEAEYRVRKAVGLALLPVLLVVPVVLLVLPVALVLGGAPPRAWTLEELLAAYLRALAGVSLPIGLGLVALWSGWIGAARSERLAAVRDHVSAALPVIGGSVRRVGMMRFLGSLSALLEAGVPVAEAYRAAAGAVGNRALAARLLRGADDLHAGIGLTTVMARAGVTGAAINQAAVGETAGRLPEMIRRAAQEHRQQVERWAKVLPYLLQLAAYAVVAPVVVYLWLTLVRVYLNLRVLAPLEELFEGR